MKTAFLLIVMLVGPSGGVERVDIRGEYASLRACQTASRQMTKDVPEPETDFFGGIKRKVSMGCLAVSRKYITISSE